MCAAANPATAAQYARAGCRPAPAAIRWPPHCSPHLGRLVLAPADGLAGHRDRHRCRSAAPAWSPARVCRTCRSTHLNWRANRPSWLAHLGRQLGRRNGNWPCPHAPGRDQPAGGARTPAFRADPGVYLQQQLASVLASTSRTPLSDTVRLLQQADTLTGDALTQVEAWPQQAPDDLAEGVPSLRQQQRRFTLLWAWPRQSSSAKRPRRHPQRRPREQRGPACCWGNHRPARLACPGLSSSLQPNANRQPAADNSPTARRDGYTVLGAAHGHAQRASDSHANRDCAHSATPLPTPSATPTWPHILPPRPLRAPWPLLTLPRPPQRTATATPAGTATDCPAPTATPTGNHTLPPATRTPRPPPPRWTPPRLPPRATATPAAFPVQLATETPTAAPPPTVSRAARYSSANGRAPIRRGDAGEHSRAPVHAYPDGRGRHHPAPPVAQPLCRDATE